MPTDKPNQDTILVGWVTHPELGEVRCDVIKRDRTGGEPHSARKVQWASGAVCGVTWCHSQERYVFTPQTSGRSYSGEVRMWPGLHPERCQIPPRLSNREKGERTMSSPAPTNTTIKPVTMRSCSGVLVTSKVAALCRHIAKAGLHWYGSQAEYETWAERRLAQAMQNIGEAAFAEPTREKTS